MPAYRNMRPLRWLVLAAIAVVLIATLQSFIERWRGWPGNETNSNIPKVEPLGGEVDQQTKAFSLSKTDGDHTVYTIKAEQVITLKESQRNLLRGVVVDIYGRAASGSDAKAGTRHDRITTQECEYDPIGQTLWVPGEVEMNFALPARGASNGGERVLIRTSQLRFDQSTGIATTDAPVRFSFPQGDGQSRGATYDPQQQLLHLKSAVEFRLREEANAKADVTTVRAGELRYLRAEARIALDGSVEIAKPGRHVRAQSGSVWLNHDNQVQRAELNGDVQAEENSPTMLADARAGRALLDFSETGAIRSADLLDGVRWRADGNTGGRGSTGSRGSRGTETFAAPEREGSSQRMLLTFPSAASATGNTSSLDRAIATENVKITLRSSRDAGSAERADGVGGAAAAGRRQVLTGNEAEMFFSQGGSGTTLRDAKLRGAPANVPRIELHGDTGAAPRTITANNFDFDFSPTGELAQFNAVENVRVISPFPATATRKADTRVTTSSNLVAVFDPAGGKLMSLRQSGNFTYADASRKALAASALYQADGERLTLERAVPGDPPKPLEKEVRRSASQPAIIQPEGRISADLILLNTGSGDLQATGAVATTSTPSASGSTSGGASGEPVHAIADKLVYEEAAKTAHYTGHTRIWQGTSFLLESESAVLDRTRSLLTATGKVLTIFRPITARSGISAAEGSNPSRPLTGAPAEPSGTYFIRAEKVSYAQPTGRISYEGKVQASQDRGNLTSDTLEITLKSPEKNATADLQSTASRIEKMIARGGVQLRETGRVGTGDTVEYFTETKKVKLYGKPATLTDPARGSTKGVQLTYQIGDNSASVIGDAGEQSETRWLPDQ